MIFARELGKAKYLFYLMKYWVLILQSQKLLNSTNTFCLGLPASLYLVWYMAFLIFCVANGLPYIYIFVVPTFMGFCVKPTLFSMLCMACHLFVDMYGLLYIWCWALLAFYLVLYMTRFRLGVENMSCRIFGGVWHLPSIWCWVGPSLYMVLSAVYIGCLLLMIVWCCVWPALYLGTWPRMILSGKWQENQPGPVTAIDNMWTEEVNKPLSNTMFHSPCFRLWPNKQILTSKRYKFKIN